MIVDCTAHQVPQLRGLLPLIEHDGGRIGEQLPGRYLQCGTSGPINVHAEHRARDLFSGPRLPDRLGSVDEHRPHGRHARHQLTIHDARSIIRHVSTL